MSESTAKDAPQMTADDLRDRLAGGQPTIVLDIRPEEAFNEWHIPGSRNVPAYEALKQGKPGALEEITLPEDRPIVTICGAGKTSRIAAEWLGRQGKDARSLTGGLRAWTFAWNTAEADFPKISAKVLQIRRTGKGCLSYLVGSGQEALVIDPALEPDIYENLAATNGWQIVGVLDTHIHADHLSRARSLAGQTGATLFLPDQDRISYSFQPLRGGDTIPVGNAVLTALHTPGHTPESMTYRLEGDVLFTGDTLFLRGVGRPDLEADGAEGSAKARRLYQSLQRLTALPKDLLVLPGHVSRPVAFDESVVGAALGQIIEAIELLQEPEERFVAKILDRVPPTPPNHETVIARNRVGRIPDDEEVIELEAGANRCAVT